MEKLRNPKEKLNSILTSSQRSLRNLMSKFSIESNLQKPKQSENSPNSFFSTRSLSQSTFYLSYDEINYSQERVVSIEFEQVAELSDEITEELDEPMKNNNEIKAKVLDIETNEKFASFDKEVKNNLEDKTTQTESVEADQLKTKLPRVNKNEEFKKSHQKSSIEKIKRNFFVESKIINEKMKNKFEAKPELSKGQPETPILRAVEKPKEKELEKHIYSSHTSEKRINEAMAKLKDLTNENNLEKWLESINAEAENVEETRKIIIAFIRRVTLENTWEMKLLNKFKESSLPTQVGLTVGVTIASAIIGYGSWMAFSRVVPRLAGRTYISEVGLELFHQRQEPAYHLLEQHAENAKFLSSAWANQYILWKYI